jgi:hypothetical protein
MYFQKGVGHSDPPPLVEQEVTMSRKVRKLLLWFGGGLLVLVLINFLLPFGMPRPASPNCGPEQWRWLDVRIHNRQEFVAYLQAHELELICGTNTPRLGGYPPGVVNNRLTGEIDWQQLFNQVWVKQRPGYTLYVLYYHPLACGESQMGLLRGVNCREFNP